MPVQAQAAQLISAPMALVAAFGLGCGASPAAEAASNGWAEAPLGPASKASALLGGAVSELERIRLAQEGGPEMMAAADPPPLNLELQPQAPLAPAIAGPRLETAACLQWARPQGPLAPIERPSGSRDDILASKRLAIGHTMFDAAWDRVSRDRVSRTRYRQVLGAAPSETIAKIQRVNRWVNRSIAYTEDRDLFARADYWAGATRTLRLRKGDCEDIALTKMQLLAAAGVARSDMVLTIARDLVRGADHALLMVKVDGRYVMLDNATDEVLEASDAHDYRPVLSFGPQQAWLHGYQTAALTAR